MLIEIILTAAAIIVLGVVVAFVARFIDDCFWKEDEE